MLLNEIYRLKYDNKPPKPLNILLHSMPCTEKIENCYLSHACFMKAIKRYYMPLTNCIVIKVVILCADDDVAWIFAPAS